MIQRGDFVRFRDYDGYLEWANNLPIQPRDIVPQTLATRTFRVVKTDLCSDSVMLLLPEGYSHFILMKFMEKAS